MSIRFADPEPTFSNENISQVNTSPRAKGIRFSRGAFKLGGEKLTKQETDTLNQQRMAALEKRVVELEEELKRAKVSIANHGLSATSNRTLVRPAAPVERWLKVNSD